MADRPILFSASMVRALLDGRKTQTRRVLPNPEFYGCPTGDCPHQMPAECNAAMAEHALPEVRFKIGDRLWVREAWRTHRAYDDLKPSEMGGEERIWPELGRDNCDAHGRARPGMFMPRWASRLMLTVTDVRVERLQDCSEADAIAEGIEHVTTTESGRFYHNFQNPGCPLMAYGAYRSLWDSINGPGAWEANPWVVAVSFTIEQRNIDAEAPHA